MKLRGVLHLPGDKSLSHRSLMFASLADGISKISNLGSGKDIESTANCLRQLGIDLSINEGVATIHGGSLTRANNPLNCGNSGTTVRLMMGLLAGQEISAEFVGDQSLSSRPMARVTEPLTQLGAKFELNDDRLPVKLLSSPLRGVKHTLKIASAQVKSALILAALGAKGGSVITDPYNTRDHTENLLHGMGADVSVDGYDIHVQPLQGSLKSIDWEVPSDPSSVAFFVAAVLGLRNSRVEFKNVLMNPTRIGFLDVLQQAGAKFERFRPRLEYGEQICDLIVESSQLKGLSVDKSIVPSLVDEIPILAILATQMNGRTVVRGAEELRVKECDRLEAIVNNLRTLGVSIKEFSDGFELEGPQRLGGGIVQCYCDHRIAMAFSIADLFSKEKIELDMPECAAISLPEFYDLLESLKLT